MAYMWMVLAVTASILWGLGYALSEKLLKGGLHPSILILGSAAITLPIYICAAWVQGNVKPGIAMLQSDPATAWTLFIHALCIVLGGYSILMAINLKNATLVGLIEITYPLFTALFAYVLFRETQLTLWNLIGAGFIFAGVGIIFIKN